ncbi:MAG: wax ester/triacylglycerol synthase family O-acyltransferase [Acidimicrobiia bacterium]|nr:wax ester/triacylglycerol synthase family O-acyltransferase [Acidimicrobiia bacterium]
MRRVSGLDAAFLYGETDAWHMHVSALLVTEPRGPGGFDTDRLVEVLASRIHRVPQFRWRLVPVPMGLDRPMWIEDPDFELSDHIRRVGCPGPGGPRELEELVGELIGMKLDRHRPLWEVWVIDGLIGGQVALLAKVHHALVDGVSGSELVQLLFDLEPDPAIDPPQPWDPDADAAMAPSSMQLFGMGVGALASVPGRLFRLVRSTTRQARTVAGFLSHDTVPAMPFAVPRTPINTELGPHRRFASVEVDLADVKHVKDELGVTVNDVVLALCSGALRRYLLEEDALPELPLVAQVPVSTRTADDHQGDGTKVGSMFASLATNLDDPAERLDVINASTRAAKEMRTSLQRDRSVGVTDALPPAAIMLAARALSASQLEARAPVFNLIVSNVPGPDFPLYVAGSELVALYPMGPLLFGAGLNVTVMGYRGSLHFGFLTCRGAVPDPQRIADGIHLELKELREVASR